MGVCVCDRGLWGSVDLVRDRCADLRTSTVHNLNHKPTTHKAPGEALQAHVCPKLPEVQQQHLNASFLKNISRCTSFLQWKSILDSSILRPSADFEPRQTGRRKIYIWPHFQHSASEILITRLQTQDPAEVILVKAKAPGFTLGAQLFSVSPFPGLQTWYSHTKPTTNLYWEVMTLAKTKSSFFFHKVRVYTACVEIPESYRE